VGLPRVWTHGGVDDRLKSLSRHYDIWAELAMEGLGYQAPERKRSLRYRSVRAIERHFLPHYFASPPRWRMRVRHLGGKRTLPDFCVVGPIKAGTSDLSVRMMTHPNIIPPLAKEFWARNPQEWRIYYPTEVQKRKHAERAGLSLSPYVAPALHFMDVPYSFSRLKPDTKVVIVLRDPTQRLFSHWKWEMFLAGKHVASSLPFLSTFAAYVDRSLALFPNLPMFSACGLPGLSASIYAEAVRQWIDCFGSKNVLVLDIGEYFRERGPFLHKIQSFVGLPAIPAPSHAKKTNENPLRVAPPDEESLSKLRQFFQPHNERLWRAIGQEFSW
jgi:hypothetical protein